MQTSFLSSTSKFSPGTGLLLVLSLFFFHGLQAGPQQAQIGVLIKAAGMNQRASVRQKVRKSDQLQLHVKPAQNQYLYLIAFDGNQARVLHTSAVTAGQSYIVPGKDKFLSVAARAGQARWMIVLGSGKKDELEAMTGQPLSAARWLVLERSLLQQGRPVLTDQGKNPASIAANMRSGDQNIMRSYTGRAELLVLQYNFRVLP